MYICMHADRNNKKGNLGRSFQNSMKMEILGLLFKLDHSMVKSAWRERIVVCWYLASFFHVVWSVTQWPLDQKLFVFISHLDGVLSLMVYPEHYWSAPKATPSFTYTHLQTPKTTYFVAENVTTKFCLMFIILNIR